ncbi:uncharacterized protein LOC141910590 [Tubulanus polymorphus]|uniref:uncharacterized protein LOC141910590 n=1 Tax=Tubulanus polymorphus TaxID=672921 RepID=UPI003DA6353F
MPENTISIRISGENVVLSTEFGLVVTFDGDSVVKVEISDEYKTKMCGICGDCDGDSSNDKVTKYGMKTNRGSDIGNSYKLVTESGECANAEEPVDKCDEKLRSEITSDTSCGVLTNPNGPFSSCHSKVDPKMTFDSCVYDMCYFNRNDSTLCRALEGYADQCREKGVNLNWRSVIEKCPYNCRDSNTVFGSCISACPRTCADVQGTADVICHEACVEGCQCKPGYVLSDKHCVEESKCGCLFNNSYYLPGESWGEKVCGVGYECNIDGFITRIDLKCEGNKHCRVRNGTRGCFCPDTHVETPSGSCRPKASQSDEIEPPPIGVPIAPVSPDLNKPVVPIDDGDPYFSTTKVQIFRKRPHALGMESGIIGDAFITASSETTKNEAKTARPLSGSGWVPNPRDNQRWIQVDLGRAMDIHGLGILGHSHYEYWVTRFVIHISIDGVNWVQLKRNNTDSIKVWQGNENNNVWKRYCFHRYYGHPINARYIKLVVSTFHRWIGMRIELYGYRDGNGYEMIAASAKDAWTSNVTGCACYFAPGEKGCACCEPGGCQCPRSYRHQCVQCGYAGNCGTLEIKPRSIQIDPWTRTETGCSCPWAPDSSDCACCQNYGCLCPERNRNQCHQCGRPQQCGQKQHVFGPNGYCIPNVCSNN